MFFLKKIIENKIKDGFLIMKHLVPYNMILHLTGQKQKEDSNLENLREYNKYIIVLMLVLLVTRYLLILNNKKKIIDYIIILFQGYKRIAHFLLTD